MKISELTYPIRKIYYRFRLFKRFMKYPYYGAWEMVEPMLEIPFEIFCEFYEQNDIKNAKLDIEKESEGMHKEFAISQNKEYDEMDYFYKWWTQIYKQRQYELDTLLIEWSTHQVCWWGNYNEEYYQYNHLCSRYGEYLFKLLQEEEQKFETEKEENLIKLMKLRNRLWT